MDRIIKLENIKTEEQASEVLDMWHDRAKRLMQCAYRKNSTKKIVRAYLLQFEMMQRIIAMRKIATDAMNENVPNFPSGGVITGKL